LSLARPQLQSAKENKKNSKVQNTKLHQSRLGYTYDTRKLGQSPAWRPPSSYTPNCRRFKHL